MAVQLVLMHSVKDIVKQYGEQDILPEMYTIK